MVNLSTGTAISRLLYWNRQILPSAGFLYSEFPVFGGSHTS